MLLSKRIFVFLAGLVIILSACAQSGIESASQLAEVTAGIVVETGQEVAESPQSTEEEIVQEINADGQEEGEEVLASTEAVESPEVSESVPFSVISESGCRKKENLSVAYDVLPEPSADDWTLGNENAYVTIIEYGDFQ